VLSSDGGERERECHLGDEGIEESSWEGAKGVEEECAVSEAVCWSVGGLDTRMDVVLVLRFHV